MAYPIVPAPYGLKPINLIGGQVFAGSTRKLPIQYSYATNIFYGDTVVLSRGYITRASVTTGTTTDQVTGVFLGVSYTNPSTKQPLYAQNYIANTLAGDAFAIVTDDPDTVFKAVMVTTQGGTIIGSANTSLIGQNVSGSNLAGNLNTGDSSNGILTPYATPVTTTLPFRVIDLVRDTAVPLGTATYSSISTATITTAAGIPNALPVGTEVGSLASNGQYIGSGSFVIGNADGTSTAAGSTTIILNQAPSTAFASSATLVFTQYPEVLVKFNHALHGYYSPTSIA
jgi:hypothetical protein